ncbi:response regulator [Daejeonella sp.]|uniref:hybrid sensor histidine kinase/response regulator transcription factor n=1 Tax=Daejeonella sp. TaxID=2805397 RepID=UPI0030C33540
MKYPYPVKGILSKFVNWFAFLSFFTILTFMPVAGNAQNSNIPYKELNINNGLPHTDAFCTVQDNKGFLWFATLDGLCRYDGNDMVIFRNNHSDPGSVITNRITALEFDLDRNGLWVGTQGGGLNFFDLITGQFSRFSLIKNDKSIAKEIVSIKLLSNKSIWVGTTTGIFKGTRGISFKEVPALTKVAESFFLDRNKGLWIGTLEGLYYQPAGKSDFMRFFTNELKIVNAVARADDSHILIGSTTGVYKIDVNRFSIDKVNDMQAVSILSDKNSIWVGTSFDGLYECDNSGKIIQSYPFGGHPGMRKSQVKNIFKDRSSSIFISTLGGGIKIINKNNYAFESFPTGVSALDFEKVKKPLCFFTDNQRYLLTGTRSYGIARFDRLANEMRYFNVDKKPNLPWGTFDVTALYQNKAGYLLAGTTAGIYITTASLESTGYAPRNFTKLNTPFPFTRVNKITEDKDSNVWIATNKGMMIYDRNAILIFSSNDNPELKHLQNDFLNDILIEETRGASSRTVWLASKAGITRLEFGDKFKLTDKKRIVSGKSRSSLYSDWVSLLHKDGKGNIWAGTIGGGLSRLKKAGSGYEVETITTDDGLLTNDIETLEEDSEGNFWLGSLGLTRYNPSNKSFSYFDSHDGLQSNAFKVWSSFKTPAGELVFGGINGFNIFYPQNISKNREVFPPQLTNLVINNRSVTPNLPVDGEIILKKNFAYTSEIELNHGIKNFGIEFASVHSYNFNKIIYRYRLLPYDKKWSYTNSKKRFVNYAGLQPGKYTFQLEASGGNGVWNDKPVTLQITLVPSFWQSIYGYMLYFAIILGLLFLHRRYSLIRLDIKHKLKLDQTRSEQELALYREKLQFFTNVSHELRTPLTLITFPVEQLLSEPGNSDYLKTRLKLIQKNADRLKTHLDQILDIRKLESRQVELNLEVICSDKFFSAIFYQFESAAQEKLIRLILRNNPEVLFEADVFKLDQILINLLSNALKFTPSEGTIELNIEVKDSNLIVSVINSGDSLAPSEQVRVFEPFFQIPGKKAAAGLGLGLSISKHLVELHGGTIAASNEFREDIMQFVTNFTFNLPVKEQFKIMDGTLTDDKALFDLINPQHDNEGAERSCLVVVEDNEDFRQVLKHELSKQYIVHDASEGSFGLKLIKKFKPELVITDVMMPGMSGLDLCRAMKSDPALRQIPVIMITAQTNYESKISGLEAMADDYITKPFNLLELKLKIKNLIHQRESLTTQISNEMALKPAELQFDSRDQRILKGIISIIEENIENTDFSVEILCKRAAMSRPVLYRKMRELTGMSIQIFILDIRLKRSAQLLSTKGFSISEAMYKSGFSSPSYFNKAFKKKFGASPTAYRLL